MGGDGTNEIDKGTYRTVAILKKRIQITFRSETYKFSFGVLPIRPHGPHDARRVVGGERRVADVGERHIPCMEEQRLTTRIKG